MRPNVDNYPLIADYYQVHRGELLNYATKRLGLYHEAEDLVQNVFLHLLTSDKLISAISLPNLAFTMTRNMICDFWRHRHAVEEYEHIMSRNNPYAPNDTASVYSATEMVTLLERGMTYLSEQHRVIYRMNVYGGLKVAEISDTLQLNYKSVEHGLGVARKKMRTYMRRMFA